MGDLNEKSLEAEVYERLGNSTILENFKEAFRTATGLPLLFVRWDTEWCINEPGENQSEICEILNRCETACEACLDTNRKLLNEATEVDGPVSCKCFTGLCATAVPVKFGKTIIGFLKTGQVFERQPSEGDFETFIGKLLNRGLSDDQSEQIREAYFHTRQVDPKRYKSMVDLLGLFSEQLSAHAEEIAVVSEDDEPAGITRARRMIHDNLDGPISLDDICQTAGMSKSHFCRVFKDSTSMTVTEYITRARIALAKKKLLKPGARVSEVAFDVGFQSLSQFNRSFAKLLGMSPTEYRKDQLAKTGHPQERD